MTPPTTTRRPADRKAPLPPPKVARTRHAAVRRIQADLEAQGFPRLQMSAIVGATGLLGLLASFVMLHLGLENMALRYPLAVVASYLGFLGMMRWWISGRAEDLADLPQALADLPLPPGETASVATRGLRAGGGGDFGGGGASGSFDAPAPAGPGLADASPDDLPIEHPLDGLGEAAGAAAEGEELAIPLLALLLVGGVAVACGYVIYAAPTLMAELLFDGVLSLTLYRHLRKAHARHWLGTALRRTLLGFVLTAGLVAVVGAALAHLAPGAHTLGQALRQAPGAGAR